MMRWPPGYGSLLDKAGSGQTEPLLVPAIDVEWDMGHSSSHFVHVCHSLVAAWDTGQTSFLLH